MTQQLAIERTRDEQTQAATLLLAGHADVRGLRQAVTDWVMEEVLIGSEGHGLVDVKPTQYHLGRPRWPGDGAREID